MVLDRAVFVLPALNIDRWVMLRVSGEHLERFELGYLKSILRKVLEMPITQPARDITTG